MTSIYAIKNNSPDSGTEGTHLNLRKATKDKTIDNVIFNGEKLKVSPLRSAKREEALLLPILFNIVLKS